MSSTYDSDGLWWKPELKTNKNTVIKIIIIKKTILQKTKNKWLQIWLNVLTY